MLRGVQVGQLCTLAGWEQCRCPVGSTQLLWQGCGEQESRKAKGSSRLRVSGFWFPFLLPAVSMETGVGPGKIRLGFAEEAFASACPRGGRAPGCPPLLRPVAVLWFGG